MTTNPYAILVTSQTPIANTQRQFLIVANSSDDVLAWSRTTNGGRGESNAWFDSTYQNFTTNTFGNELIVGEILSAPLAIGDITAIQNNERPTILIQKLTKQFGLRQQSLSNRTLGDVVAEIEQLIATDPTALSKYRSDGRSDKSVVREVPVTIVRTPVVPTITPVVLPSVEPTSEVVGDFVASIPTADSVAGYVTRTFADGVTETAIYDYALSNKKNVSLEGEAGTGKTTSLKHYAFQRGLPFYSFSASVGAEYSQLFGKIIIGDDGKPTWQDGAVTQLWKTGGVLVIDEANFLPAKIASSLHNALDDNRVLTLLDHKGQVVQANPNLLVAISYNQGYRSTNKMNEAFLDRFTFKLKFEYDIKIESKFIKSKSLLELFSSMRADSLNGLYETPLSTRLLKNFQELCSLGYDFAVQNLLNNFNDEERGSVALLFEAKRYNIMSELGFNVDSIVTETGDELVNA
jgi:hypothetical protein